MFNPKILLLLFSFFFFSFFQIAFTQNVVGSTKKVPFSFTLTKNASTSAGVFLKDSTLVRTLWSGIKYNAGKHIAVWDGLDDEGVAVGNGEYIIKVLSNNVTYTWQGVVGNTSNAFDPATLYHSYEKVHDMAITGSNIYMAIGYDEQGTPGIKATTTNPQENKKLLSKGAVSYYVATDGNDVYWSAEDFYHTNNHWVYVTKVSDNTERILSKSGSMTAQYGRTYKSSIDIVNNTKGRISGLAVQQSGNFLFVSHSSLNEVHVINKKTGALVQTFSIINPRKLAVDNSNNLWIVWGKNLVTKYQVNSSGITGSSILSLQGLSDPLAIEVSPDGSTVTVLDGSTSQQVKAFNNNNGAPSWTFGEAGGYVSDASVRDDKFYFNAQTYISYEPDGTFWVGDVGNSRSQHYTTGREFIERIMYLPASYSSGVDPNNITRVFSDYLEFKVDYSIPLGGTNGSWTLVKNWAAAIKADYDDNFTRLKGVTTLSNGRTYATLLKTSQNVREVVELPATGNLRYTGIIFPNNNSQLYPDGSIRKQTTISKGNPTLWTRRELVGFNSGNNPVWGPEQLFASSPKATEKDPLYWGNPSTLTAGEVTSTNLVISFDGGLLPNGGTGYHLGAIKPNDNKWLWRTAKSTHTNYSGPYPADGAYDIGNNNLYAGIKALVLDRNIIWGYHGEFWKASQTNKYNHVYDDGLFVGQFGATGVENGLYVSGPGNAGNALSPVLVKDANGDMYLYHNDESYHSGVHRWKITDLNTIEEQSIEVKVPAAPTEIVPVEGVDLMAGLPFNSVLSNNTSGWTRYPLEENYSDVFTKYWKVKTSVKSYDKLLPTDIYAQYRSTFGIAFVNRDLGNNKGLKTWDLSGIISWEGNNGNNMQAAIGGAFFQVLDNDGKVIAQMYYDKYFYGDPFCSYYGNKELIVKGDATEMQRVFDKSQPFSIVMKDENLIFKYADYPPVTTSKVAEQGADMKNPATVRLYFNGFGFGANYDRILDVGRLSFLASKFKPLPPTLDADDDQNTLNASHVLGNSEIVVSENNTAFKEYKGKITVGNVNREGGYWKFKIKSADDRDESDIVESPAFKSLIAPKVTITSPSNNSKFESPGTVNITADATDDDGQVTKVEFFAGTELIGKDETAPYSITWSNVKKGTYSLTAKATDEDGLITVSSALKITVYDRQNVFPKVAITSPSNNSEVESPATIKIITDATDEDGQVTKVEFFAGNELIGKDETTPYSFTWSNIKKGTYSLTAKATDNNGSVTTSTPVTLTVYDKPNVAPKITITSPSNSGEVESPATIKITTDATDEDGQVAKVEFFAGNELIGKDETAPYSFTWSNIKKGTYSLTAKATDDDGSVTTSLPVTLAVYDKPNVAPKITITSPSNNSNLESPGTANITTAASDDDGQVIKVEFFAGNELIGKDETAPYNFSWSNIKKGTYTLTAKATDDDGSVTTSTPVILTVYDKPNVPPKITITSPSNNSNLESPGTANITTDVSDDDGQVTKVEFFAGNELIGKDETAPYSFSWSNIKKGTYTLTAKATDNDGSVTTSIPVILTVYDKSNAAPKITITSPSNNSNLQSPGNANITTDVSDDDGQVTKVEFFAGTELIGKDETAPFSFTWSNITKGIYSLTAKATDDKGLVTVSSPIAISVYEVSECAGTGAITWQYWSGFLDVRLSSIPINNSNLGGKNLTSFATPNDFSNFFAAVVKGYICPPVSGEYIFFLSTDDNGELWLSTDDQVKNKKLIASVDGWTNVNQYDKYPSQKSISIYLQAGKKYYVEGLYQDGAGGDHLSVAWKMPNGEVEQPIAGSHLIPFFAASNIAPKVAITSPANNSNFISSNDVTITSTASDEDGQVSRVDFYAGNEKLGQDGTSPYSFVWSNIKPGTYTITAKAVDSEGLATTSLPVVITVKDDPCTGTGSITWNYWLGFGDPRLSALPTYSKPTGTKSMPSFATIPYFGDYYGSQVKGFICPPVSGEYTFFLATDDNGELWLSTNEKVENKKKIATVQGWTNVNEYDKYPSQKSEPIYLQAGKRYYVEALQQERGGGDHLSVAWKMPDGSMEQPIAGSRLIPFGEENFSDGNGAAKDWSSQPSDSTKELEGTTDAAQLKVFSPELELKTYPNPFAKTLNIECSIPENNKYLVQVFTVQGVLLKTIFSGNLKTGVTKFTYNAGELQSGTYVCRITSGKKAINKLIILAK